MKFRKYKSIKKPNYIKNSYSQCGEDLIISFIFDILKIDKPYYVDIGAHHPWYLSNTALLYQNGSKGILIEADPILSDNLKNERPNDLVLNLGISANSSEGLEFYVFNSKTLSTFNRQEAKRIENETKYKIKEKIRIPTINYNTLIDNYAENKIDLLSIDVEGLDFQIISSIDFELKRPTIICIETLTFNTNNSEIKIIETIDLLKSKGYLLYADTYINSIFVDKKIWENR